MNTLPNNLTMDMLIKFLIHYRDLYGNQDITFGHGMTSGYIDINFIKSNITLYMPDKVSDWNLI